MWRCKCVSTVHTRLSGNIPIQLAPMRSRFIPEILSNIVVGKCRDVLLRYGRWSLDAYRCRSAQSTLEAARAVASSPTPSYRTSSRRIPSRSRALPACCSPCSLPWATCCRSRRRSCSSRSSGRGCRESRPKCAIASLLPRRTGCGCRQTAPTPIAAMRRARSCV